MARVLHKAYLRFDYNYQIKVVLRFMYYINISHDINSGFMNNLPIICCTDCGVCCKTIGCPPFLAFERNELPDHLKAELSDYSNLEKSGNPCIWLTSDNKCKNYEHRPMVCKDFEIGSESCLEHRRFYNIHPS